MNRQTRERGDAALYMTIGRMPLGLPPESIAFVFESRRNRGRSDRKKGRSRAGDGRVVYVGTIEEEINHILVRSEALTRGKPNRFIFERRGEGKARAAYFDSSKLPQGIKSTTYSLD